jgi:hypothetical protein
LSIADYVKILTNSFLQSENSLEIKEPVIREFVDTVRAEHFSPIACVRRSDTTMKQNANAIKENIGLLSYYKTVGTNTVQDLVRNVHVRGGNQKNRYSLMSSIPKFFEMRRMCEELMIEMVGATATDNNVAAHIDLEKFIDLYLKRIFLSLDPKKHFDEDNVCKFEIYMDLTNDGTVCGNMAYNFTGFKMYLNALNGDRSDNNVKNLFLQDKTVCIPLGVFIDTDNFENLYKYHQVMYQKMIEKFGDEGIYELDIGGQKFKFVIKYAFSGDLKSHAQAAGMKNLVGVNAANFMFCCFDKQKHSHLLPHARKCRWCMDYGTIAGFNKRCRHIPYQRFLWKLPKEFSKYQSIIDAIRDDHNFQLPESITSTNKRKRKAARQQSKSDDETQRLHFINLDLTKDNAVDQDLYKEQCMRLSEYKQTISTLPQAETYMTNYKVPKVSLYQVQANSNLHANTSFSCIDNATVDLLQYHIRIRACQNKQQMEEFKDDHVAMNNYLIHILQHHYDYFVGNEINNCTDIRKQSADLLYILLLVEQYIFYFFEENRHTQMLVQDKMKLVICDLHMEMRIGLKLLENLINYCCMFKYKDSFANEIIAKIQHWINTEVFRNKGTGKGSYKFPIEENKCKPITLTNASLLKILKKIDGFIDLMINHKVNQQTRQLKSGTNIFHDIEKYRTLIKGFLNLMHSLRQFNESNTDEDYIHWQMTTVDPWIESYIDLFGKVDAGYYIHYLARGHVCEQLMYFKNIHRHSQQTWEGLIGRMKKYIASHTQHGGNKSGGKAGSGSKKQEPMNIGILRYMLRSALFSLFPKDEDILTLMEQHKDALHKKNNLANVTVIETPEDEDDWMLDDEEVDFENFNAVQGVDAFKLLATNSSSDSIIKSGISTSNTSRNKKNVVKNK